MSDQEIGKKEVELTECHYFVSAYEDITGERLVYLAKCERPDFIYARPNNERVGIELVWVEGYRSRDYEEYVAIEDVIDQIWCSAEKKESKRAKGNWSLPDNTILVLQLGGCRLSKIIACLDDGWQQNFESLGFAEIWLCDFTQESIDAFEDIDVLGLHPARWFGHLRRPNLGRKPYG